MSEAQSEPPSGPLDTVVVLPMGYSGADVARQCRETAVQFVNESARWGKPELAMWLAGPYSLLTRHLQKEQLPGVMGGTSLLNEIDVRLVDRILRAARTDVHETLAQICADQSSSFVLRALISGSVARCEDGCGEPAWAPVGGTRRLADRVLSLFAVDYLVRPGDYETDLAICPRCSYVAFDAVARRRGFCSDHAVPVYRKGHTVPYPGLEMEA